MPNSAVLVSKIPLNGAVNDILSISFSAIATDASADCMLERVLSNPAVAEATLASAALTAALALATLVSLA